MVAPTKSGAFLRAGILRGTIAKVALLLHAGWDRVNDGLQHHAAKGVDSKACDDRSGMVMRRNSRSGTGDQLYCRSSLRNAAKR